MPAEARARAPVRRFAVLESLGSEDEVVLRAVFVPSLFDVLVVAVRGSVGLFVATQTRMLFRQPKYRALPAPVRITLGTVPRHNDWIGFGPLRISRRARVRDEVWDCWTRVLRRSAGWRRTAVLTPLLRPARKWNAVGRKKSVTWFCMVKANDLVEDLKMDVETEGDCTGG